MTHDVRTSRSGDHRLPGRARSPSAAGASGDGGGGDRDRLPHHRASGGTFLLPDGPADPRPRSVFELGSGFGYSTAWFARAVQENGGGVVHHVVWDADLSARARKHLAALSLDHLVRFHVSEAVAALQQTPGPFDLIFNDIDKAGYPAALPVIQQRLRPGGVLLADNLLWHGRILDPVDQTAATAGIREFTDLVMGSPEWTASVVPIRDGVLVAQRA